MSPDSVLKDWVSVLKEHCLIHLTESLLLLRIRERENQRNLNKTTGLKGLSDVEVESVDGKDY